jgi:hypothetical protein
MPVGYTASGWTQFVVALSIFGPVAAALAITIFVLRGTKSDPDEQRWRQQAEERKRLAEATEDSGE